MNREIIQIPGEIEVTIRLTLDNIDRMILSILNSRPNHSFRMREIQVILSYEGIDITSQRLNRRMEYFSNTALIRREKRGRFYSYTAY